MYTSKLFLFLRNCFMSFGEVFFQIHCLHAHREVCAVIEGLTDTALSLATLSRESHLSLNTPASKDL